MNLRTLTVCSVTNYLGFRKGYSIYPVIRLLGRWLEKWGFKIGDKVKVINGSYGTKEIIEQALRFYFRNASVTVWEKSVNIEDDSNDKHLQKLILRSNRLVLEHIKERTVFKQYDRDAVSPIVLRDMVDTLPHAKHEDIYFTIR